MFHKALYLVTDMYGCPNRCRHCWLGHMPNRAMEPGADAWLVDYFKPDFETVVFYSWLREPDFCDGYRARWERDNALSVGGKPVKSPNRGESMGSAKSAPLAYTRRTAWT